LVNEINDCVFATDINGVITFANKAHANLFGFKSSDEIEGKNISEFIPPGAREEIIKRRKEGLKTGKIPKIWEFSLVWKDGSTKIFEVNPSPIFENGVIVGTRGVMRDITERKMMEDALRSSEQRLRLMFESVTDGVTVTDLSGIVTDVNEKVVDIHGCKNKGEILGKNAFELIAEHDRARAIENMRKTLKKGFIKNIEYNLLRSDSSEFPGELSASVLKDTLNNPIGFIAITRDISEQKRLRENMQFYIAEITRAQEEERKRIARELHDDTTQSLATLALEIDAVGRGKKRVPEEARQQLQYLREKTINILEEVRRFSHQLRPDVLDQLGLMPALELLTKEMNREGKIKAHVEISGSVRRLSSEAELVLFRIAQEALRNASRHSEGTAAMISVSFTKNKVTLVVTDNGHGFKIPTSLGEFASKGKLGLIGMQERARLLGGTLTIQSKIGEWTKININVSM
jgi:PAS domain S-box-containing protein